MRCLARPRLTFGVGLAWLLAMASLPSAVRAQVPDAELPVIVAPVTDPAGFLDSSVRHSLAEQLLDHQQATGVQLAVLLVETTAGEPIEDYALRVAMQWRGGSAARDDGALYVLAVRDRRQRLEVGYGLEDRIPDYVAARALGDAIPHLRDQDYAAAVQAVVSEVILSTGDMGPLAEPPPEPSWLASGFAPLPVNFAILLLGTFVGSLRRKKAAATRTQEIALGLRSSATESAMLWMALYVFFMGTGAGLLGFGWLHYLSAFVGVLAGWRFAWDSVFPTVHFLIMATGFGVVAGLVLTGMSGEVVVGQLGAFAGQLAVTFLYAGNSRSGHTSFSASGVQDEDQAFYDQVRAPSVWHAPERSPNASHFGALGDSSSSSGSHSSSWSSSSSSSSSRSSSSSSSSRSSGYSGGGGRFGGGGASSSW